MINRLGPALTVVITATIAAVGSGQPPRSNPPVAQPPAVVPDDAFVPDEPWRVRLPENDWRTDLPTSPLPPPPGWVAAEVASLGGTMGSSPEAEPLSPGDEQTLETGRVSSHKDGFFQKFSFTGTWLNRGGSNELGITETRMYLTVAVPLPSRDFPLLISPGFDVNFFDGPATPDLPSQVYDAYLDFMWLPKLSERWMGILAVTPGVYSDFDDVQSQAFRTKAKGMARFDWIPHRLQLLFGVLYLNREDVNMLPAGGVIWDPNDDTHYEILFPRPKFAHRLRYTGTEEDWVYLAGEFGGDTWSVRRASGAFDVITQQDWRIYLGVERKRPGGGGQRLEVGYVFGREVQFTSATPTYNSGDTLMIRAGIDF